MAEHVGNTGNYFTRFENCRTSFIPQTGLACRGPSGFEGLADCPGPLGRCLPWAPCGPPVVSLLSPCVVSLCCLPVVSLWSPRVVSLWSPCGLPVVCLCCLPVVSLCGLPVGPLLATCLGSSAGDIFLCFPPRSGGTRTTRFSLRLGGGFALPPYGLR